MYASHGHKRRKISCRNTKLLKKVCTCRILLVFLGLCAIIKGKDSIG